MNEEEPIEYIPDYDEDDNELILDINRKEEGYDDSNSQMSILLDNMIKYFTFRNPEQEEGEKWKSLMNDNLIPEQIHKLIIRQFSNKLKCMIKKDKIILKRLSND
jgi:hypothetical protein